MLGADHMIMPNLPVYLGNGDKAFFCADLEKPSRVAQCCRDDYDDNLGAWVWEHDEKLHPDVFTGQTATWRIDR